MSWLFGKKGGGGTGVHRDLADCRDRQIANMQQMVHGLECKQADKALFEVQLHVPPDARSVCLRIFLPTNFPEDRPVLQLLSQVQHPWVNQYMQVVGHPRYANWDGNAACTGSPEYLVGNIIAEIAQEFRSKSGANAAATNGASATGGPSLAASTQQQQSQYGQPTVAQPTYGHYPQLSGASYYNRMSGTAGPASTAANDAGAAAGAGAAYLQGQPGYGPGRQSIARSMGTASAFGGDPLRQGAGVASDGAGVAGGPTQGAFWGGNAAQRNGSGGVSSGSGGASGVGGGTSGASGGGNSTAGGRSGKLDESEHHVPLPPVPARFNELENMTLPQLRRLLEDDVARRALLEGMPSVAGMREVRADMRRGNAQVAEATLAKAGQLAAQRAEAAQLQAQLRELCDEHAGTAQAHARLTGGGDDGEILRKLKAAAKEAERASQAAADGFTGGGSAGAVAGKPAVAEFVEPFVRARQRFHVLDAKAACMKRQIQF